MRFWPANGSGYEVGPWIKAQVYSTFTAIQGAIRPCYAEVTNIAQRDQKRNPIPKCTFTVRVGVDRVSKTTSPLVLITTELGST
jgi:hypothetical protein